MLALTLALVLALASTAAAAHAQAGPEEAERTAAARALFEEGMRAVDARDWETAADRLRRSQALRSSPVVRFNLALALSELGHFVAASEHLRAVLLDTEEGSDVHRLASERLEAILPRLGRLRIDVSGPRSTVEVRLDGERVPDALIGVPQPADPGAHRVSIHRADEELGAEDVSVTSGQLATVALVAPPAPTPEEAASTLALTTDPVQPAEPGIETQWWFWTIIGVVVAGAAVAIAVAATSTQTLPYVPGDSGAVHPLLVELP